MVSRSYFCYWGKAQTGQLEGEAECHLLPYHCLDVAAVGWQLLGCNPYLLERWSSSLKIAPDQLRRVLVFFLGIHDIGKFSRAFQSLAQPQGANLVPVKHLHYIKHDVLGEVLWKDAYTDWRNQGYFGRNIINLPRQQRRLLTQTLREIATVFFGHHGKPVFFKPNEGTAADFFVSGDGGNDREAAGEFVRDWYQLMCFDWPLEQLLDEKWLSLFRKASWEIIGWATLGDWLGSNHAIFSYYDQPMALAEYWQNHALTGAVKVLAKSGFDSQPVVAPYAGIASWFGGHDISPTPLQVQSEKIVLGSSPQLFILEDITGAGKTEAACILAQRLMNAGAGNGLYFALPTMATSNAMYHRLGALHHHFYSAESHPSLVLAHGAREMNEKFAQSLSVDQPDEKDYKASSGDLAATTWCNRWFADSRKKALLADVGVGTIDQLLMGILAFKHQCLRLLGMAGKVLIIDEVHAYDVYMLGLLKALLTYHAANGGSVIMLTATLPQQMRQDLVSAWQQGLGLSPKKLNKLDFPLLTQVSDTTLDEIALASRPRLSRSVDIKWIYQPDDAVEKVISAVEQGLSVVWVRNTVNDAIDSYQTLKSRHPDPARCLLFHARFTLLDRQRIESEVLDRLDKNSTADKRRSQLIVTTQVFQESLDCDCDLMISDIAPIDLLIQRVGRLQRHERGERLKPTLYILAPEWHQSPTAAWLQQALPGTQAVYRNTALIWRTQKILRDLGAIRMPEDARELIEYVYSEDAHTPEGLQSAADEYEGNNYSKKSLARFNMLDLEKGYKVGDQWSEKLEMGTRLSDEDSINVVLLKLKDGELKLWAESEPQAVMLSQLRLRKESQAGKLAPLSEPYLAQWEELQKLYRGLHWTQPWLPVEDPDNHYDSDQGARLKGESSVTAKKG